MLFDLRAFECDPAIPMVTCAHACVQRKHRQQAPSNSASECETFPELWGKKRRQRTQGWWDVLNGPDLRFSLVLIEPCQTNKEVERPRKTTADRSERNCF